MIVENDYDMSMISYAMRKDWFLELRGSRFVLEISVHANGRDDVSVRLPCTT
jgi:hypothetical protein